MREPLRLALIGAGNLGSRHLQALAKLRRPAQITVVEPSEQAAALAASRFAEIRERLPEVEARFHRHLDALAEAQDVAIVATNADSRAEIIRRLVAARRVKALVLEKVLFTKPADYADIGARLGEAAIPAWVNCPRRLWPFYRTLKDELGAAPPLEITASGADWGLGCNAIHMLDLAAWLAGTSDYAITGPDLDAGTRPARRPGFLEFTGALSGRFATGPVFRIASWRATTLPFALTINAPSHAFVIDEERGRAMVARAAENWRWDEIPCEVPRQSELTHAVVEDIVERGTCGLSSYEESAALHQPLVAALLRHLAAATGAPADECPIT